MSEQTFKRSDLLSSIYQLLPEIDDDYAAKLVYRLENKQELANLQKNILDLLADFGHPHIVVDTIIAKVILDEISLHAANYLLRIKGNAFSLFEVSQALALSDEDTSTLINFYASIGSEHFFDIEFPAELKKLPNESHLSDVEKVKQIILNLLSKAKQDIEQHAQLPQQNKKHIYQVADKYQLSLTLTASLIKNYATPGATDFMPLFDKIFTSLQKVNQQQTLNASLTAKTLLAQLTQQEAQNISLASKLLKGRILEDDLILIARRYLKQKTPQDIAETFEAVLKRLPHNKQKEENIQLAVRVLLTGTEQAFEQAQKIATLRREKSILSNALRKQDLFAGYETELVSLFAGKKTATELLKQSEEILKALPHVYTPQENYDLVCNVLLENINLEQAQSQASKRCQPSPTHKKQTK